jgi:hypothetical protein
MQILSDRLEVSITHHQPLAAFRKVNLHAGGGSLTLIIQDNTFAKFLVDHVLTNFETRTHYFIGNPGGR